MNCLTDKLWTLKGRLAISRASCRDPERSAPNLQYNTDRLQVGDVPLHSLPRLLLYLGFRVAHPIELNCKLTA
jgi:hypothetical protein